ncbi:MAG TPA: hypothetical protein DCM86_12130, partial [Verrucomicrobiales bacterium]|nr:hypothetical protein [Verrucomicrobiales bacterium]
TRPLVADGHVESMEFDVAIERSSWVALRVLGSSHSNPVFVVVDGKPIRASRRSAEWCLKGVDQCWSQKERFLKPEELEQARSDYQHARAAYQRILEESTAP